MDKNESLDRKSTCIFIELTTGDLSIIIKENIIAESEIDRNVYARATFVITHVNLGILSSFVLSIARWSHQATCCGCLYLSIGLKDNNNRFS